MLENNPNIIITSKNLIIIFSTSILLVRDLLQKYSERGTSLIAQGPRLHAPNARGPGLIPGSGIRSHMPQLRVCKPQLRPGAAK